MCLYEQRNPGEFSPGYIWLDKAALAAHVCEHPDALLRERAAHFGVRVNAIWVALRQLGIRKKRRATLK